jgi:Leucine-rich repeat (LRR) protein
LGNLINLETLYISNKLNSIPSEFGNLINLETLYISNKLNSILSELGNLINLKLLSISKYDLAILPKQILNLNNLKMVDNYGFNFDVY